MAALSVLIASTRAYPTDTSEAASILDIGNLPRFRPVAHTGFFSSYDRTGGNDDGFSGRYSVLRQEGDGLVIAEVRARGAITRLFVPTPTDDLMEFYFDGETTPRISYPMRRLFTDPASPLAGQLTGSGLGGYFSYVPLEFEKSIKVVVRGPRVQFYHISYVTYDPEVPVRSFQPGAPLRLPVATLDGKCLATTHVLPPKTAVTLFETHAAGRVQSLRLGPASAFSGPGRDIVLRITWDDAARPAVEVPVGDFFGYSFGRPATASLLVGTKDDWNYIHFPMPFAHAARIELLSEREIGPPLTVQSEIIVSDRGKTEGEGYFHATWHRENPTRDGSPFTYADLTGRGHLVAVFLQAQGFSLGNTYYFEGDDEAVIDGELAFHGTGSEDSFNGGWFDIPERWNERGSLPFSGCLDYQPHLGRTGGYRLFIGDAFSFQRGLRYTIEHGAEKNNTPTDYVGTAFFYLDQNQGMAEPLLDLARRSVGDPGAFALSFTPRPPPIAWLLGVSFAVMVGPQGTQFGSLSRNVDAFPPNHLGTPGEPAGDTTNNFDTWWGPPRIAFSVDIPKAGVYAIDVEGIPGPYCAMLQLRVDGAPSGKVVDFYAAEQSSVETRRLAEVLLSEGTNKIVLSIPGRNLKALGESVHLIRIKGTRLH